MIQEQVLSVEMVVCGVCLVRKCVHEYICVCVTVCECVFACASVCAYICAYVDTLVCLGKRSDVCMVHLWGGGGAEDAGICPARGDPLAC